MRKKIERRLVLGRETLRALTTSETRRAAGGGTEHTTMVFDWTESPHNLSCQLTGGGTESGPSYDRPC